MEAVPFETNHDRARATNLPLQGAQRALHCIPCSERLTSRRYSQARPQREVDPHRIEPDRARCQINDWLGVAEDMAGLGHGFWRRRPASFTASKSTPQLEVVATGLLEAKAREDDPAPIRVTPGVEFGDIVDRDVIVGPELFLLLVVEIINRKTK